MAWRTFPEPLCNEHNAPGTGMVHIMLPVLCASMAISLSVTTSTWKPKQPSILQQQQPKMWRSQRKALQQHIHNAQHKIINGSSALRNKDTHANPSSGWQSDSWLLQNEMVRLNHVPTKCDTRSQPNWTKLWPRPFMLNAIHQQNKESPLLRSKRYCVNTRA